MSDETIAVYPPVPGLEDVMRENGVRVGTVGRVKGMDIRESLRLSPAAAAALAAGAALIAGATVGAMPPRGLDRMRYNFRTTRDDYRQPTTDALTQQVAARLKREKKNAKRAKR